MKTDWFFSKELSPSHILVDKFADSKFEIDKWTSFAREIVQNSLDAHDDDAAAPVIIKFDLNKSLSINDIPGCAQTLEVLKRCRDSARNKQTKGAYEKGIEILSKDKVYCLKISDFNTRGVTTGRNNAWGALVYDEGVSVKQRPGSAGSHGVGKKVPFIISSCNTVFYASKNKMKDNDELVSDSLFEGKTMLINWQDENNNWRNPNGWFGKVVQNTADGTENIDPLMNDELSGIPDYFKRIDSYGTDVIIVGVNAYEKEGVIKKSIINAIIDNFFVAISRGLLEVSVFGESITKESFNRVYDTWYEPPENPKNSLKDCLEAYVMEPEIIPIKNGSGNIIGNATIYFKLGNSFNKKYYTVIRSHGMKIKEYRVNRADQPYSAVVVTDGKELNDLLSDLENAAHDDFIVSDDNLEIPQESVDALYSLKESVSQFIIEKTKIDDGETQSIEGLSSIITIPGLFATVTEKNREKPRIKRNPIRNRSNSGMESNDYENGSGSAGTGRQRRRPNDLGHKPNKRGGSASAILYEEYAVSPFVVNGYECTTLTFNTLDNIKNATIRLSSINSEEKADDSLNDIISKVVYNHKSYKPKDGTISGLTIKANEPSVLRIHFKRNVVYQIRAELYYSEDNNE